MLHYVVVVVVVVVIFSLSKMASLKLLLLFLVFAIIALAVHAEDAEDAAQETAAEEVCISFRFSIIFFSCSDGTTLGLSQLLQGVAKYSFNILDIMRRLG